MTDYREVTLTLHAIGRGKAGREGARRERTRKGKGGWWVSGNDDKKKEREREKRHGKVILCRIFCFQICSRKFSIQSSQTVSFVHVRRMKQGDKINYPKLLWLAVTKQVYLLLGPCCLYKHKVMNGVSVWSFSEKEKLMCFCYYSHEDENPLEDLIASFFFLIKPAH